MRFTAKNGDHAEAGKSKRIEFTPGRGTTRGQNALKWMSAYARVSGTFDGFNFHSFFRL